MFRHSHMNFHNHNCQYTFFEIENLETERLIIHSHEIYFDIYFYSDIYFYNVFYHNRDFCFDIYFVDIHFDFRNCNLLTKRDFFMKMSFFGFFFFVFRCRLKIDSKCSFFFRFFLILKEISEKMCRTKRLFVEFFREHSDHSV